MTTLIAAESAELSSLGNTVMDNSPQHQRPLVRRGLPAHCMSAADFAAEGARGVLGPGFHAPSNDHSRFLSSAGAPRACCTAPTISPGRGCLGAPAAGAQPSKFLHVLCARWATAHS